ncbi:MULTISPECIES: hypothetical protein [Exiguobacterium]|uniref:hypothetical protein n=1 Tax=Exiguobacterium TaxID=33986 RepID=UPI001BE5FE16|nr:MULTISPECIES: hypothetical protein [Exiguobacterium]MCT4777183.1 hypothetical protein [Exiguobacterium aquaticum]MCT4787903.1 hypothetical protein [Exiguobacterium mexicanum]
MIENQSDIKDVLKGSSATTNPLARTSCVILQPIDESNYKKTIEKSVPFNLIEKRLTKEEVKKLKEIYNGVSPQVWGITDTKRTKVSYKDMQVGDVVLFNKSKNYFAKGVVTFKAVSEKLSEDLWGTLEFKNIYFIGWIESINISNIMMNEVIDIEKMSSNYDYPLFGVRVLKEKQSQAALDFLDIENTNPFVEVSANEFEEAVRLNIEGSLDTSTNSKGRVEQRYLRNKLFGKRLFEKCACCGFDYPVTQLYAAHIKKRKFCNVEEKLDTRIVMPMCKYGCDVMFEDGYIGVEAGKFKKLKNNSLTLTTRIEELVSAIEGKQCSYWTSDTKSYFEWHKEFHENK